MAKFDEAARLIPDDTFIVLRFEPESDTGWVAVRVGINLHVLCWPNGPNIPPRVVPVSEWLRRRDACHRDAPHGYTAAPGDPAHDIMVAWHLKLQLTGDNRIPAEMLADSQTCISRRLRDQFDIYFPA